MAGRNRQRLEEIRQELSKTYGEDLKVRCLLRVFFPLLVWVVRRVGGGEATCYVESESGRRSQGLAAIVG